MNAQTLKIDRAASFASRLLGLLARQRLAADEALYLAPCSSVHTLFMRYAIDVAFVDRQGRVVKLVSDLQPYRAAWCLGAHGAVELASGGAQRHCIREGNVLPVGRVDGRPA